MARGFSGVRTSLEARPFPSNAGGLAFEGCIWDGLISRSMPRVRHGVAGLTWAGVGTSCQGRRLTSTCRRPPPTSASD